MTEEDYSIYYNEEDEFGGGEEEPVPSEEIEVEEEEEDLERPRQPVVKRRVKATVKKSPGAMGKFEITDLVSRRAIDLEHDAPPLLSREEIDDLISDSNATIAMLEVRRAVNALKLRLRAPGNKEVDESVRNNPYVQMVDQFVSERLINPELYEEWDIFDYTSFDDRYLPPEAALKRRRY